MKHAPSRDTIAVWIAVIAGSGILSLLVRHASIHRFGMDEFSGNILFFVSLALLVGLYLGLQSVFEDITRYVMNFFQRKEAVVVAETSSGEHIAIRTADEPQQVMQFTDTSSNTECEVLGDEADVPLLTHNSRQASESILLIYVLKLSVIIQQLRLVARRMWKAFQV